MSILRTLITLIRKMNIQESTARMMHVIRTLKLQGSSWNEIERFNSECVKKIKESFKQDETETDP